MPYYGIFYYWGENVGSAQRRKKFMKKKMKARCLASCLAAVTVIGSAGIPAAAQETGEADAAQTDAFVPEAKADKGNRASVYTIYIICSNSKAPFRGWGGAMHD